MNLLTRYILRSFIKNVLTIALSFIAIYILIDFFEKIDNFMEKGKSMGLVAKFFLLNIPFILEQMGPVCILLGGVVTLGVLNHSNELIALKSCGIPLKKIINPIVGAAMLVTLLLLALSQFVLPKTMVTTNHIWNEEIKGRIPLGIYRHGRYYYHGYEGAFFSFARPDPRKNQFLYFSYATWDDQYHLTTLIAARKAVWKNGIWTLYQGQLETASENDGYRIELFDVRDFGFPEKPADFFVSEYHSLELSLLGLYREALRQKAPDDRRKAWAEFYGRISYILLGLPLLLLGLPLLLLIYRKWGRDLSLAIPVSCGLAFACWGGWATLQSLAKAGYLDPLVANLSVHLFVGLSGLVLLLREDT